MKKTFTINEQGKIEFSLSEIYQIIHDSYEAGVKKAEQIKRSTTQCYYPSNQIDNIITTVPLTQSSKFQSVQSSPDGIITVNPGTITFNL